MSLLDDIKAHYEEEKSPPDGPDLDYVKNSEDEWVKGDTETKLVSSENKDTARWGTWFENVYQRGAELVAVFDIRPATEYQDWGDYGEPKIYPVEAHTETKIVTTYKKVDLTSL